MNKLLDSSKCLIVTGQDGPERVCLRLASSVWLLDFMWERFHNMSTGDFQSMFTKAGDSETRQELSVEEATGKSIGSDLLWVPRNFFRKK